MTISQEFFFQASKLYPKEVLERVRLEASDQKDLNGCSTIGVTLSTPEGPKGLAVKVAPSEEWGTGGIEGIRNLWVGRLLDALKVLTGASRVVTCRSYGKIARCFPRSRFTRFHTSKAEARARAWDAGVHYVQRPNLARWLEDR